MGLPLRLLSQFLLTILLVWGMSIYWSEYFFVGGSLIGYTVIGALLTLLNIFVRPFLSIIALPLKLFATLLAIILVNIAFLWVLQRVASRFDPEIVSMTITGGMTTWIRLGLFFGFSNWVMKLLLK